MVKTTKPKGKTPTARRMRGERTPVADRQLKIQKALYEIANAAGSVTDMQTFYADLHRIVGKLMYAKNFYVTLYDPATQILSAPYFVDETGDVLPAPARLDPSNKSLRGIVVLTGKTLHLSAEAIEEGSRRGEFTPMGTPAEDWIGVPLKMNGRVIGSLTVQSYKKGVRYDEQDVRLLEFVAQHIAVALTRARAIEETRQRNNELQVINSVQQGLASNLDIHSIYTLVGDKLREIFAADTTFIAFRDDARNLLHVHYYADRVLRRSFRRPYGSGIAELIIESGSPLLLRNEREQQEYGALHVVSPGAEKDLNQSVLGAPIFRDGKAYGAVTVQSYTANAFDENQLRLLQTLANSMSLALENARLFNDTQQSNTELQIINSVQKGLASRLEMRQIYELVGEKIRETFNAQVVSIAIYDPTTKLMHGRYYFEDGRQQPGLTMPLFGFRKHVIENGRPLLINQDMPRWMEEYANPVIQGLQPKSAVFIPMRLNEEAPGVISLQNNEQENAFTEADVRLLTTLASSMSVALENARLFDETQRLLKETQQRNAELAIINSVQAGLASQLDLQAIYELVGDKIREIFDANTVVLATFDVQKNLMFRQYVIERGKRYRVDPTSIPPIWHQFIQQGRPILIQDNLLEFMQRIDPAFEPLVGETPKCALSVPLRLQGEVGGVISLQNVDRENAFNEADMRLLGTLANSLSIALHNARLFEETQQRNEELAIINSVQAGLASKLDMQAIYELIGEKVREVFHVEVIDIVNYDPIANLISMPYSYEKGDRNVFSPREPYGFRRQVIESRSPLLINQDFEQLAAEYNNPLLTGSWPKSALFVPLLVDGQVKSIISIQDLERENAFSASDVQLLQTLSNAMAVALENARLFDETQHLLQETEQRAQELATINTVSAALAGELDLNALIELVGEQVRSVFKADIAFVALLDHEKSMINFPYQYGQQLEPLGLGQGLTSRIIQSGQALLINEDIDRQRQQMGVKLIGTRARSFLGVPIFVAGQAIGVVSVQSTRQEGRFTEDDRRLLSTIAANVGIAFQNARLFHETQRLFQAERKAHQQTETLRSVAQALNRSLSLPEVFQLVLTEIQKVIPYDSAGIYRVHGNRRVFVAGRGFANLEDLVGVSFKFNRREDEIGYLISRSLQPLILADAPQKYPQYFSTGTHAATKIRSYMAVPIVLNQKLIGMITLDREEPGFYTEEHAGLAMAFAAQAATAIHNAQLFDETQQRNAELAIINSVQAGLASQLDIQGIYELVGDKIREIFDANTVALGTFDLQKGLMHRHYIIERGVRYNVDPAPIPDMWRQFIQRGQSVWINKNFLRHMRRIEPGYRVPVGEMPKSVLSVPLRLQGETRGVISLQNVDRENAFSQSDVRLLETLANSMSVALENARLWEQEKLYRRALERELEIGREIQTGFLPDQLPAVEGWEIAASLLPAREVAGDFYDAFELPDGNIGLVIADVCDKGVGAALFMTLFRSLIRVTSTQETFEQARDSSAPCCIADRLHHAITLTNTYITENHGDSGMFATIFFGILDPHTGSLTYINGGHEPPRIVRSGQVNETLLKTGPAVGAVLEGRFETLATQLNPGDMLFAFTDGAPETGDPQGEFFGHARLMDILRRCSDSSHELVQTIETELHRYMDGATQFDDITLLAVRRAR
jgi:GAF domain-containing protein